MSQDSAATRPAAARETSVHGGNVYVGPPLGRSLLKALLTVAAAQPSKD
ncbi:hypothetical protein [Conexibacter sp. SYSU D00693]|nr:hypothetical protein [Conexibacter sp. SYSU D00693]